MTTRRKTIPRTEGPAGLTRWAAYARVSTQGQADKDLSIPAQQRACREHAYAQGWVASAPLAGSCEFEDGGLSGTSMERPGLQAMLAAARRGEFDVLVVHKLDRLSREELDCLIIKAALAECGVRLVSVTESFVGAATPMDQAMEGMARTWNKLFVANLKAEVAKVLRDSAVEGGRQNGIPPYGYRWKERQPGAAHAKPEGRPRARLYDGWEVDPDTAPHAAALFERFDAGGALFTDLAKDLNARGVPHPGAAGKWAGRAAVGSGWYPQTVRRILSDRRYLGEVHYGGAWYPGAHPAVVGEDLFDRVQRRIEARAPGRSERTAAVLAGGLMLCPHCLTAGRRSVLYAVSARGPKGAPTYGYRCSRSFMGKRQELLGHAGAESPCPGYQIAEAKVLGALSAWLASVARQAPARGDARPQPRRAPGLPSERALLERELAALPQKRRVYQDQQAEGHMEMHELAERLAGLKARQAAIEARLAEIGESGGAPPLSPQAARELLSILSDPSAAAIAKRDALRRELRHVVPSADKSGVEVLLTGAGEMTDGR